MKKTIIATLALSCLALPTIAMADTTKPMSDTWSWEEWYEMENNIGLNVIPSIGYTIPLVQGESAGSGYLSYGAEIMWKPREVMNNRLGISAGAFFAPIASSGISVLAISVPIVARYYFVKQGGFQPYAGLGLGINMVNVSGSVAGVSSAGTSATTLSGIVRLGTDLMFSPNIGAEVNVDADVNFSGGISYALTPGVGIRILF